MALKKQSLTVCALILTCLAGCTTPGTDGCSHKAKSSSEQQVVMNQEEYLEFLQKDAHICRNEYGNTYVSVYRFTQTYRVNELLADIAKHPKLSEGIVVFSDLSNINHDRMGEPAQAQWTFTATDQNIFSDAEPEYAASIAIDDRSIDLDNLRIPYGLRVRYGSRLTDFLDFHNDRVLDADKANQPATTSEMVWPIRARFVE